MNKPLKLLIALVGNGIIAGFFGLGCALINLIWLEFAIKHFPAVSYTTEYQTGFGMACAIGYMLIALFRMLQSRLDTIFPQGLDVGILFVLLAIIMIGATPVPNTHFIKYLIDRNTIQVQDSNPSLPKGP